MTAATNPLSTMNRSALLKAMGLGAAFALALMIVFLMPYDYARPEWGRFWLLRPFVVISLAGATGGAIFYFMLHITEKGTLKRALAIIFSAIIFVFGLWIGTVLGLVGTMWN